MLGFDLPATAYKIIAEIGVVLALVIGAFFYGNHVGTQKGDLAIANLTAKYEKEEADLLGMQVITNEKIVTQVVTKVVKIHDQANTISGLIPLVPDIQPLSLGWVSVYNAGATGSEVNATTAANGASSGITAAGALPTITNNDTLCRAQAVELQGLQDWINAYNANVDAVNKNATSKHK